MNSHRQHIETKKFFNHDHFLFGNKHKSISGAKTDSLLTEITANNDYKKHLHSAGLFIHLTKGVLMRGFKFGILLALIMAVSYILPADNGTKKADHKITYDEAVQYQANYQDAIEAGDLKMPEVGFYYNIMQAKEMTQQKGGETLVVAGGADEFHNFVIVMYVIDKNGFVKDVILERGSCCPDKLKDLQMAAIELKDNIPRKNIILDNK